MRIGVDVGGTKTEVIALDDNGLELYRERRPTPRGNYEDMIQNIIDLVLDTEAKIGERGTVGVGIPGSISLTTKKVKNANTTEMNGRLLGNDLGTGLERQVRIMNDANCLAVSEAVDGAGAGNEMVLALILGTGCGAGIAINGQGWVGRNQVAGEWGHTPLPWMTEDELPGHQCWCGKFGCLETYTSGSGFCRDYADHETGGEIKLKGFDIISIARDGDKGAQAALDRFVDRLARALGNIINVLDPNIVVLGGGMSNVKELYEMVPPLLPQYVYGGECDTPVVQNKHGDSSGVRGAAWLWPKGSTISDMKLAAQG